MGREIEELAGDLDPEERREMAATLERWAHTLRTMAEKPEHRGPWPQQAWPPGGNARRLFGLGPFYN